MRNLIIGFILGLIVATVGFTGIARMLDRGVQTVQEFSKEAAQ
jgi:capsular polysaccharide biosynthesis protein